MTLITNDNIINILQQAYNNLDNINNYEFQQKYSVSNCHNEGVFSFCICDTIRCFIILNPNDVKGWNIYNNNNPHNNNEYFLIHNHRYPLTSIPLSNNKTTTQCNILFKEYSLSDIKDNNYSMKDLGIYKKYKYYSAFFEDDKKGKHKYIKDVYLQRISYSINEPWFMDTNEIHRIVWNGSIITLLYEHRDCNYINKNTTDAYLIHTANEFPCDTMENILYKPINNNDYITCKNEIRKALKQKLQEYQTIYKL